MAPQIRSWRLVCIRENARQPEKRSYAAIKRFEGRSWGGAYSDGGAASGKSRTAAFVRLHRRDRQFRFHELPGERLSPDIAGQHQHIAVADRLERLRQRQRAAGTPLSTTRSALDSKWRRNSTLGAVGMASRCKSEAI